MAELQLVHKLGAELELLDACMAELDATVEELGAPGVTQAQVAAALAEAVPAKYAAAVAAHCGELPSPEAADGADGAAAADDAAAAKPPAAKRKRAAAKPKQQAVDDDEDDEEPAAPTRAGRGRPRRAK